MKKKYFFVLPVVAVIISFVHFANTTEKSELMAQNVEVLTTDETTEIGGYCTIHIKCYNVKGQPTGKYSATSYWGKTCRGTYHSHTCSSCQGA